MRSNSILMLTYTLFKYVNIKNSYYAQYTVKIHCVEIDIIFLFKKCYIVRLCHNLLVYRTDVLKPFNIHQYNSKYRKKKTSRSAMFKFYVHCACLMRKYKKKYNVINKFEQFKMFNFTI